MRLRRHGRAGFELLAIRDKANPPTIQCLVIANTG
jgi:hypothetical protein